MDNSFFIYEDEQIRSMDDFEIPKEWWSRPFEYCFANKFLNENDVVCDAGCGIEHPFKNYASKRVKELIAIDTDERIKELKSNNKLKFKCLDIKELGNEYKGYFDKIFCISVLEHDIPNLKENLKSFEKALKDEGIIILTMDYPLIKPDQILNMLKEVGLNVYGDFDYTEPSRMLRGYYSNLSCFSLTLRKKESNKEKIGADKEGLPNVSIQPKEIKPLKIKEHK
jgi:SAM-dependent methyltransferase